MAGINILAGSPEVKENAGESKNAVVGAPQINGTKMSITLDATKARESSSGKVYTMYVSFVLPNGRRCWGNLNIAK